MVQISSIFVFTLLLLFIFIHSSTSDYFPDDDPLPALRVRNRRFIRIHSRPPESDAKPQYGIGFSAHLNNFLKGGRIGMEFKMPKGFDRYMEKFGKKFPFFSSPEIDRRYKEKEDIDWIADEKDARSDDIISLLDPRKLPK